MNTNETPSSRNLTTRRSDRRGFLGGARAAARYLFDGNAPVLGKLILVAAVGYMVLPVDLLPDAVPVVGWLDDLGVFGVAWAVFKSYLNRWEAAGPAATPALPAAGDPLRG